jgi:hypothetical protein
MTNWQWCRWKRQWPVGNEQNPCTFPEFTWSERVEPGKLKTVCVTFGIRTTHLPHTSRPKCHPLPQIAQKDNKLCTCFSQTNITTQLGNHQHDRHKQKHLATVCKKKWLSNMVKFPGRLRCISRVTITNVWGSNGAFQLQCQQSKKFPYYFAVWTMHFRTMSKRPTSTLLN